MMNCCQNRAITEEEAMDRVIRVAAFANREGFELSELLVAKGFLEIFTPQDHGIVLTPWGKVRLAL